MNEQTLALAPGRPIFIQTMIGLIRIDKVEGKPGDGFRRVRFTMPKFMKAFIGEKDDLKTAGHVTTDKDGRVKPTFSFLTPLIDENGELIGVVAPTALRLDEKQDSAEEKQEERET